MTYIVQILTRFAGDGSIANPNHPAVADDHVLLGWEGLEDEAGAPLAYSQAEAIKLLADPTMHRLMQWLETAASSADVYRVERLERDRKN